MKKLFFLIFSGALLSNVSAQKTVDILKNQAGQGVKEGATIATEHAADKVTDKLLGKLFSGKKKSKKNTRDDNKPSQPAGNRSLSDNEDASPGSSGGDLQTYSKYDFVPGAKVLVYDDFSQDAIGDFPQNWNTNSAGEIVTASGQNGKWLMLTKKGMFLPEFIKSLPDNFTLEFDLIYSGDVPRLQTLFMSAGNGKDGKVALNEDFMYNKRSGVTLGIQPISRDKGGQATIYTYTAGDKTIDNHVEFQNNGATKIKVSVWRQKQRVRVYIDQNKVFDLPRAFTAGDTYNNMMFTTTFGDFNTQAKLLISNIKLAAGAPDTRDKLISEGKFSTTGILFDVNSATIKPESYGSLKDIADVLKDNAGIRIKIIGHTDNDGDAAKNLALSKKRAEAVRSVLQFDFKIDAARMQTDGKGSSDPVADNKTPAGKAQNRRVEFVKM